MPSIEYRYAKECQAQLLPFYSFDRSLIGGNGYPQAFKSFDAARMSSVFLSAKSIVISWDCAKERISLTDIRVDVIFGRFFSSFVTQFQLTEFELGGNDAVETKYLTGRRVKVLS